MGLKLEATPGGSESTPVAFQEAGNKRGGEEHTSMGSGSAYRGEGGGPPYKKVQDLCYGPRLGPAGEGQSPGVGDWSHPL